MRKAGILLVCLLVIGIAGLFPVGNYLSAEKANIQMTENVLYGDKALAEGIKVTFGSRLQWQHYWDSVYTIGANPEIETQYTFYPLGKVENSTKKTYDGITFGGFPNYGSSGSLPMESRIRPDEFLPAYQELADVTPNGASGFENIRVNEYFTFYPVWPDITTEYFWYEISGPHGYIGYLGSGETVDASNQKELYEALNAYFRIPVPDNDIYQISLTKKEDGTITDVGGRPAGEGSGVQSDTFIWNLVSVYDEEAIYFTFVPYSSRGVEMSTDLIPGGFGVYRLPYEKDEDGIYHVKEKELQTVCSLDPNKVKKELRLEIGGSGTLRVITGDEKTVYFYAFDMEEWKLRQELSIARQSEERMAIEYEGEDFMVCSFGTDNLIVVECRKDGTHEMKCRIPMGENSPMQELVYGYDGRVSYDWNGKQLVYVVSGMANAGEVYLGYQDFADFHVGICDETGLLYLADYLSGLHVAKERLPEYRYSGIQCQMRHSVLAVEWAK